MGMACMDVWWGVSDGRGMDGCVCQMGVGVSGGRGMLDVGSGCVWWAWHDGCGEWVCLVGVACMDVSHGSGCV